MTTYLIKGASILGGDRRDILLQHLSLIHI